MLIGVGTTMWGWTGNAPELRCHHSWDPNEGPRVSLCGWIFIFLKRPAVTGRHTHTSRDLLFSTGMSAPCSVIAQRGKSSKKAWKHTWTTASLCCTPETNTAL